MRGLDIRELVGIHSGKLDLAINCGTGLLIAGQLKHRFTDFDVLLSHQQPAHWIAYKSKRPYAVLIHSFLSILYPKRFHTLPWDTDLDRSVINLIVKCGSRDALRQIDQASIRGASRVLVCGRRIGEIIHEIYGVKPLRIPFALDVASYKWTSPQTIFEKYSITRPLILTVTRALPSKRPDLMIRILPRILKDHPSATLVIASNWSRYQSRLRGLARKVGVNSATRLLTVPSDELNALYSGASVVGYPAEGSETVGRVPIEAMCFGVPPVVWDNEWGPAEVVKDGVGMRAKPYDEVDFADKVLALLNDDDLLRRMGERAKLYAGTFSWEQAGPYHERALRDAIT
jgi:glycosyltransferase involved in cell wall biosynthesis